MSEKLYTLQEVADYLKVTRQTVYNYLAQNKIKAFKMGGREYRVTESDLQAFLRQHTTNK